MKLSVRKELRDSLIGKSIKDVIFHDSHGLVIDLVLEDDTTVVFSSYDSHHEYPNKGELFVAVNGIDYTFVEVKNPNGWAN